MKLIIAIFNILLFVSCSTKKDDTKSNEAAQLNLVDSVLFEGKYTFRKIIREDGKPIYVKETTDFYSAEGSDKKNIVKSTLRVTETPSWYPQYNLILEKYDLTDIKEPAWKKEIENEVSSGFLWDYFETKKHGCCSLEDGSILYRLSDGKQMLKFTGKLEYYNLPTHLFVGYNASESVNYEFQGDSSIVGNLYFLNNEDFDSERLLKYFIKCKGDLSGMFIHTPDIGIIHKSLLEEKGFFRAFKFYQNGEELNKIDTSSYYLKLEYAISTHILIPVTESGKLEESELITNNKEVSKNFSLEKIK